MRWSVFAMDHGRINLIFVLPEVLSDLSMTDGSLTSGKNRTNLRDCLDESDEVRTHLLFGVKRNLMKLIGNLCYKSRRCQDKVSTARSIQQHFMMCPNKLCCELQCICRSESWKSYH